MLATEEKNNSKLLAANTRWKKKDCEIEKKRREKDREKKKKNYDDIYRCPYVTL